MKEDGAMLLKSDCKNAGYPDKNFQFIEEYTQTIFKDKQIDNKKYKQVIVNYKITFNQSIPDT